MAAEFAGRYLTVRVATIAHGDSPNVILQVVPERGPDIEDWPYAEWDSRLRIPVPAGWDLSKGNPWLACRYSGPLKSQPDSQSLRFCSACGAARVDGAEKCGACNASFGSALPSLDLEQIVRDVSADTAAAGAVLAELIHAHIDGSVMNDDQRADLRGFFEADFDELGYVGWVRGDSADGPSELTLGAAQELQRAVAAGESLSPKQLRHAEVLLKYAPLQFGYWGPFKALVKAVPVDDLAEAYADAVARLSGTHTARPEPDSISIENIDFLKDWFDVPRSKTRRYLARKVRRSLASLAKRSPDTYARVAARMLISWDQPLSDVAYAPAYVMLGAGGTLDERGKCVRWPANMDARQDAYPEIWDERPALVGEVFRSVRSSVEVLIWAFQVLESVGAAPDLAPDAIGLALDTDYADLRRVGCADLPQHPEIFGTLGTQQWTSFFELATDAEVAQAADALTAQDPHEPVGESVAAILARPGVVSDRRARFALLYFAARKVGNPDADIAALVAVIDRFRLDHQSLWHPVLAAMKPQDLLTVYRTLAESGADDASLQVIADALIGMRWVAADLVFGWVCSADDKVADLGWRFVDVHGGGTYFLTQLLPRARYGDRGDAATALRIVAGAFPRSGSTHEVVELIRWAMSTDIDRPSLASMLVETPIGRSALWEAMATGHVSIKHDEDLWELDEELVASDEEMDASRLATSTPDVLRTIGDTVVAQQLSTAAPAQLAMILHYIEENPVRIELDAAFGVAAFTTACPSLEAEALRQLLADGHLPQVWRVLADSGVPDAFEAARTHVQSLRNVGQVRDAVLACLRSNVPAVRDIGIQLVRTRDELSSDRVVWTTLAESDDRQAQELVAEATLVSDRVDEAVLAQFDQRILTDQPPNRRAKELVKRRIQSTETSTTSAPSERIAVMLDLARGENGQDREWALMRLAALALQGNPIEGLEVSLTTTGTTLPGDVAS